jgi:hypothetical protein
MSAMPAQLFPQLLVWLALADWLPSLVLLRPLSPNQKKRKTSFPSHLYQ